jgi:hypothetical protein
MHCHVAFHAEQGFGLSFLERAADYKASADFSQIAPVCNAWVAYAGTGQDSTISGIKMREIEATKGKRESDDTAMGYSPIAKPFEA